MIKLKSFFEGGIFNLILLHQIIYHKCGWLINLGLGFRFLDPRYLNAIFRISHKVIIFLFCGSSYHFFWRVWKHKKVWALRTLSSMKFSIWYQMISTRNEDCFPFPKIFGKSNYLPITFDLKSFFSRSLIINLLECE